MEAQALPHAGVRHTHRPIQLVLVRANGPLFYSVAAASLLEHDMPVAADRLLHFYGSDQSLSRWITSEWLPRKLARAAQLREYVRATWPEYDWNAGREQYRATADAAGGSAPHRPSGAHEALARCVATAQSAIFYRTLAHWAEDPRLRELARDIAYEEASSFGEFRALYDRRLRSQGFACATAWTTAFSCVRAARDTQVPRAFNAINAQCAPHVPFPVLDYPDFVGRMGSVIERHANLGTPERILFRTWKARPRLPSAGAGTNASRTFTPVIKVAA